MNTTLPERLKAPATISLICECCLLKVGESRLGENGVRVNIISIKIRGRHRRDYIVETIRAVTCERCGHEGPPLPVALDASDQDLAAAVGRAA